MYEQIVKAWLKWAERDFPYAEQNYAFQLGIALDILRKNGINPDYRTDVVACLCKINLTVLAKELEKARMRMGIRYQMEVNLELIKQGRHSEVKIPYRRVKVVPVLVPYYRLVY